MNINFFMNKAIEEANKALFSKEVPVGAILVDNLTNNIISKAHNLINTNNNASAHAEIILINTASKVINSKYLVNTSLFVTLEPCAMCAAAISEMHIKRIYFGAYDEKKGSLESIMHIYNNKNYFVPEVFGGIHEKECSKLIKDFFLTQR